MVTDATTELKGLFELVILFFAMLLRELPIWADGQDMGGFVFPLGGSLSLSPSSCAL